VREVFCGADILRTACFSERLRPLHRSVVPHSIEGLGQPRRAGRPSCVIDAQHGLTSVTLLSHRPRRKCSRSCQKEQQEPNVEALRADMVAR